MIRKFRLVHDPSYIYMQLLNRSRTDGKVSWPDDEFPASLQIFTDKNMLDYMHYETVWYAIIHMLERIQGSPLRFDAADL